MLLGNYSVLHKSPLRFFGGSTTSVQPQLRSNFNKSGSSRNRLYVSQTTAALTLYSLPSGNAAGKTWLLPQKSGEISSRNDCALSVNGAASGAGGVNGIGSAALVVDFAPAAGSLIVSGAGSAGFSCGVTGFLSASLQGVGSSSFSVATNSPLLGAEASLIGSSSMSFVGALTPYAIGSMSGSTVDTSVLTVDAIAAGVLAAAVASPINADVRKVNGYEVDGTGQPGAEWGPV